MNIRILKHSHEYSYVSGFNKANSSAICYHNPRCSSCPAGHWNCVATHDGWDTGALNKCDKVMSTAITTEYSPRNIRARIHDHEYNRVNVSITRGSENKEFGLAGYTELICGAWHSECDEFHWTVNGTELVADVSVNISKDRTTKNKNIRQIKHTHTGYIDVSISWIKILTGTGSCPAGHSNCKRTSWEEQVGNVKVIEGKIGD